MKCPNCSKTIPDTAKFFAYCGTAFKSDSYASKPGCLYFLGSCFSKIRLKRRYLVLLVLVTTGFLLWFSDTVYDGGIVQRPLQDWSFQLRQTISPYQIRVERRGNDNAEMVFVPAGEFTMGSPASIPFHSYSHMDVPLDEHPQHVIYLDAFWIDKHEVTNAQYKKCVDDGGCKPPSAKIALGYNNFPFGSASWEEANLYCQWTGKRLSTEAEWEKAARGTDGRIWPWGNSFDENRLNYWGSDRDDLTPVDYFLSGASPYGALNMAGNVGEWVADWYDRSYYTNSPPSNPKGPSAGNEKVWRGGGFNNVFTDARAASRFHRNPSKPSLGFRCTQ